MTIPVAPDRQRSRPGGKPFARLHPQAALMNNTQSRTVVQTR
jgi:hypothetical protein